MHGLHVLQVEYCLQITFPKMNTKCTFQKINLTDDDVIRRFLHVSPLHSISLIVPNSRIANVSMNSMMNCEENLYILAWQIPLHLLLEHMFIEYYIKKGHLWLLTINANGSTDNFVSVFPPGQLLLSLERDIYEKMGIPSSLLLKKTQNNDKYDLTIDLLSLLCEPKQKCYEKLVAVFKKMNLYFDAILTWSPSDSSICRTSIQKFFQYKGLHCQICSNHHVTSINYSVAVPKVSFSMSLGDKDSCSAEDLLQWIGAQIYGIQCEDGKSPTNKMFPQRTITSSQVYVDQWKGMFHPEIIAKLSKEASRVLVAGRDISFAAILAHGYQDSWSGLKLQEITNSNSKAICIVLFPDENCWVFKV